MTLVNQAIAQCGLRPLVITEINAGAAYFAETGMDIEPGGEEKAGTADAIFLGAIGLPTSAHKRDRNITAFAVTRTIPALCWRAAHQSLCQCTINADPRSRKIDFVIPRIHCCFIQRLCMTTMKPWITRETTEKLHRSWQPAAKHVDILER